MTEYVYACPNWKNGGLTAYHTNEDCHRLRDSAVKTTLQEAKKRGLSECKECRGVSMARTGQGDHSLNRLLKRMSESDD